jgi:hypothetical protein
MLNEIVGRPLPDHGDRVQLQQVPMNFMINSIEAMKDVDGTRQPAIKSQRADGKQLNGLGQRSANHLRFLFPFYAGAIFERRETCGVDTAAF